MLHAALRRPAVRQQGNIRPRRLYKKPNRPVYGAGGKYAPQCVAGEGLRQEELCLRTVFWICRITPDRCGFAVTQTLDAPDGLAGLHKPGFFRRGLLLDPFATHSM